MDKEDLNGTFPFAGLTRFSEGEVPHDAWGHGSSMRWWASERTGNGEADPKNLPTEGFTTRANRLPRATTVEAGWKHPITDEWVPTGKHNAVVNPSLVEEVNSGFGTYDEVQEAEDDNFDADEITVGDDALYTIPTDDYTVINPMDFLQPLAEVIRAEHLQDKVFGEFRVDRGGGRVSADILFDGKHVEAPGMDEDRKPIVVGMQLDYDFFGDTAVTFRGIGMDYECVNALRAITDPVTVKHAGDVEERVDWKAKFEEMLEQLELKTDQLSQLIEQASEETLDLSVLPDGFADDYPGLLEAFYAYAGLPDYLAKVAAENARANAHDPFEPDWWTLHRGATFAITHEARGEVGGGGAIEAYNRIANDMLVNPAEVADAVERNYEADQTEESNLSEEGGGVAEVAETFERVRAKREKYEDRADQIKSMVAEK